MTDRDLTRAEVEALLAGATEGPWSVERNKRTWGWVDVAGPSLKVGGPTQATDLTLADEVKRLADARLIAASPTLARQLLRCMKELDDVQHMLMAEANASLERLDRAEAAEQLVATLEAETLATETLATERLHSLVAAEAVNARLTNERDTWREGSKAQAAGCEQLRAEVARLRAMLTPPEDLRTYTPEYLACNDDHGLPGDLPMVPADIVAQLRAEVARLREWANVVSWLDNGEKTYFSSSAGGAAPGGEFSEIGLMRETPDGKTLFRDYVATGPWRPAALKSQSDGFAKQKGGTENE